MSPTAPRFLLVDDHALFRTGLSMMLSEHWPQAVFMQAATWAQALAWAQGDQGRPDLVMLDIQLPDGHGLDNLPQLQGLLPGCPILLMSALADAQRLSQAERSGAVGFVPKVASARAIVAAVRSALDGASAFAVPGYVPVPEPVVIVKGPASAAAGVAPADGADAPLTFTARQLDILRYLGRRTPNKAIARQLGLNEDEVRAEVSWITEALDATSRQQAYDAALARGLITR